MTPTAARARRPRPPSAPSCRLWPLRRCQLPDINSKPEPPASNSDRTSTMTHPAAVLSYVVTLIIYAKHLPARTAAPGFVAHSGTRLVARHSRVSIFGLECWMCGTRSKGTHKASIEAFASNKTPSARPYKARVLYHYDCGPRLLGHNRAGSSNLSNIRSLASTIHRRGGSTDCGPRSKYVLPLMVTTHGHFAGAHQRPFEIYRSLPLRLPFSRAGDWVLSPGSCGPRRCNLTWPVA
ncbi:hypothetical protein FKP32DRAFT_1411339 [Trametes sanguinea]|nr:hypothetical protein FKP32DRAFT_1411339 [Trametes sanguinea]